MAKVQRCVSIRLPDIANFPGHILDSSTNLDEKIRM